MSAAGPPRRRKALSDAGWRAENLTGGAVAWAAGEDDG